MSNSFDLERRTARNSNPNSWPTIRSHSRSTIGSISTRWGNPLSFLLRQDNFPVNEHKPTRGRSPWPPSSAFGAPDFVGPHKGSGFFVIDDVGLCEFNVYWICMFSDFFFCINMIFLLKNTQYKKFIYAFWFIFIFKFKTFRVIL